MACVGAAARCACGVCSPSNREAIWEAPADAVRGLRRTGPGDGLDGLRPKNRDGTFVAEGNLILEGVDFDGVRYPAVPDAAQGPRRVRDAGTDTVHAAAAGEGELVECG